MPHGMQLIRRSHPRGEVRKSASPWRSSLVVRMATKQNRDRIAEDLRFLLAL